MILPNHFFFQNTKINWYKSSNYQFQESAWLSGVFSGHRMLCMLNDLTGFCNLTGLQPIFVKKNFLTLINVSKSPKKYFVLESSKKQTLGQFYEIKNCPSICFLWRIQDAIICFWDLLTFSLIINGTKMTNTGHFLWYGSSKIQLFNNVTNF